MQNASSVDDWKKVVETWEEALSTLQKIPSDNQNYNVSQEKIKQYESNLKYAKNAYWDALDESVEPLVSKIEEEFGYRCIFIEWNDGYAFTVPNPAWQSLTDDQRSFLKSYTKDMGGNSILIGKVISADKITLDTEIFIQ